MIRFLLFKVSMTYDVYDLAIINKSGQFDPIYQKGEMSLLMYFLLASENFILSWVPILVTFDLTPNLCTWRVTVLKWKKCQHWNLNKGQHDDSNSVWTHNMKSNRLMKKTIAQARYLFISIFISGYMTFGRVRRSSWWFIECCLDWNTQETRYMLSS